MRGPLDRILLVFAFIQVGLEYQSICLFRWPLNHSCAKPAADRNQIPSKQEHTRPRLPRTTSTTGRPPPPPQNDYNFNDSRKNPVDPDAIQTNLFDAYPDDPFTLARAHSMGIKFDDIAGCLQYKHQFDRTTNTSSVDLSQLETCPHGLHFERPGPTVSVVEFFKLACSRQYLTILLPGSFAAGLLLGIVLTALCLIKRVGRLSGPQFTAAISSSPSMEGPKDEPANLYYWFLVQITAILIIQIQTYTLSRFIDDNDDDDDDRAYQRQRPELYGKFVCCILLRSFVAASNLTRIILTKQKHLQSSSSGPFQHSRENFFFFCATYICFRALYGPVALHLFSSWWQLNEWLAVFSFCFTVIVFGRKLVISRRESSPHGPAAHGAVGNQLVLDTNINEETEDFEGDFPVCEFCSPNESPICIVDSPYRPTTTSIEHDTDTPGILSNGGSRSHQVVHHRIGSLELADRNLLIKLVLVTFCLSFNHFLIQMLPDHGLLHSETIASRLGRKLSYAEEMAKQKKLNESYLYTMAETLNGSQPERSTKPPVLHDVELFVSDASQPKQRQFDFRNMNGASKSIATMRDSVNPIELLWATAKLYKWTLDLLVLLLHLKALSNFETLYFKLSRLFILVQLGAKLSALQWLLICMVRRQNHLLEWDWLWTICLLVAHLSSSLMLFNYTNTMLKLSGRLMTSRLMLFLPNTLAAVVAFLLASSAPLLEWIDLAIIPVALIVANLMVIWLTKSISLQFRSNLCPMIFEDQKQKARPTRVQRMCLVESASETC